jgi:hypothetical protein
MAAGWRRALSVAGSILVGLGMLAGGALVYWNVFGQAKYGSSCDHSLGCRSFYCLHHELVGSAQLHGDGSCTQACERDDECGAAARCVVLGDAARDDLPPFGKPTRACMPVRAQPATPR